MGQKWPNFSIRESNSNNFQKICLPKKKKGSFFTFLNIIFSEYLKYKLIYSQFSQLSIEFVYNLNLTSRAGKVLNNSIFW